MKNQAPRSVMGARECLDLQWCGLLKQARWQVGGKKSYDQNQTMGTWLYSILDSFPFPFSFSCLVYGEKKDDRISSFIDFNR